MKEVSFIPNQTIPTLRLSGRIDSTNAAAAEQEIQTLLQDVPGTQVQVDAEDLEYLSSAGLRVLLRLRKSRTGLTVVNVSPEVYDVLEMTGFTEIIPVSKAFRRISVEGCDVIGEGANGTVYRLDPDTIVKVYLDPDALDDIRKERELARTAFILGVPTAIPYDVVKVGDLYGSVFELLNAKSFAELLMEDRENADKYIRQLADLLKLIHSTEVKPGSMPDMKQTVLGWVDFLEEQLPEAQWKKLRSLAAAVPERHTMLHGDYHAKNVMMQNGEVILIDMDTLCMGHPVFEMASVFNAYTGFYVTGTRKRGSFIGLDPEMAERTWNGILLRYADDDPQLAAKIEQRAALIGYVRLYRRILRRNGLNTPEGRQEIELYRKNIGELLEQVDDLTW